MRDMGDNNGGGKWANAQLTDKIDVMFGVMGESKERLFGSGGLR